MSPQHSFDTLMERHQAAIAERKKEEERKLEEAEKNKVIQLPLWPEPIRGIPNAALRGSLFAAVQNNRKTMKRALIVNEEKLKVRFTGIQLDQSDLEVWEHALHLARTLSLGNEIYFTAHGFLKALGRPTGKAQHEWLKDVFARLCACCVEITHEEKTYFGSLVEGGTRDETDGRYKLTINPRMARLYTAGWTGIHCEERRKIGNKRPLALWMHGYIASHAKIYPTKVETYRRLSGSDNKSTRDFKRKLREALTRLQEVELIQGFEFKGDIVHIANIPSKSQIRHLDRSK
jgi:hypothetical protein